MTRAAEVEVEAEAVTAVEVVVIDQTLEPIKRHYLEQTTGLRGTTTDWTSCQKMSARLSGNL